MFSTGADQYDCYAFPNRSVAGNPAAVGVSAACVGTAGTEQFNFICRIGGVTYDHSTIYTATTTNKLYAVTGITIQPRGTLGRTRKSTAFSLAFAGVQRMEAPQHCIGRRWFNSKRVEGDDSSIPYAIAGGFHYGFTQSDTL